MWSCELFLLRGVILKVKGQHRDGVMGLPETLIMRVVTQCVLIETFVRFVLCKDSQ